MEDEILDQRSPDISDEARQRASAKKGFIAPLTEKIVEVDENDEAIANKSIAHGPTANIPIDTEKTKLPRNFKLDSAPIKRSLRNFIIVLSVLFVFGILLIIYLDAR